MPKLKSPEGRIVSVSEQGIEPLKRRGYTEIDASPVSERPAKSATRAEWDEYAKAQGLDPEQYGSKDDLIEALGA